MCIICLKVAGMDMPSDERISNMFSRNSDGAGFAVADGDCIRIRKGFMTLDEFKSAIAEEGDLVGKSVIMHFRITTHGGTSKECCHPFPLTDDLDLLQATDVRTNLAVAHNGVIPNMDTEKGVSDTMAYIRDILYPLSQLGSVMDDVNISQVIYSTLHSKMAVMNPNGRIVYWGDFESGDDGLLYSNSSYKQPAFTPRYSSYSYGSSWDSYSTPYAGWDDDDWEDYATLFTPTFDICEECPLNVDCSDPTFGEDCRCRNEEQAIRTCATELGMSVEELGYILDI